MPRKRRICFVTGTRADFGLMEAALTTIAEHPALSLQIIATGMHLDPRHGRTIDDLRRRGWKIDRVVPWAEARSASELAVATGNATAGLARALHDLKSDVVLLVGDRVEALAAATAGHVSGRAVAHVHGGDRALGQIDDSIRHAVTKLAHIHFPATRASEKRLMSLGENRRRVHRVGSPGIDGIAQAAASASEIRAAFPQLRGHPFTLLVLHPTSVDAASEYERAQIALSAVQSISDIPATVVVFPNNDPGKQGILRCWKQCAHDPRVIARSDIGRGLFLGLMRDAVALVGNSSSGIIEAASFGTPVLNLGDRQFGRERNENVIDLPFDRAKISTALQRIWRGGRPRRYPRRNVYGSPGVGRRVADALAAIQIDDRLLRKIIAY